MSITVTTTLPPPPDDADFAIYIDFKKGEPNPQRVFQAADAIVKGLHKLDLVLCDAVDSNIKPILVLEDIQAGSLRIWLKNRLEDTSDEAIKSLDWKKQVGEYLVRGKYIVIDWLSKPEKEGSITDLSKKLQRIAADTDVKHLPDYKAPSVSQLIEVVSDIDSAKGLLSKKDKLSYITKDGTTANFNMDLAWSPENLTDLIVREKVTFPPAPMILTVKKPDYLGKSRWEFRHGRKTITCRIDDTNWLRNFQNRKVDVRPGDALRCSVVIEHSYGFDNELISETYVVTAVEKVLERPPEQDGFFDDELQP